MMHKLLLKLSCYFSKLASPPRHQLVMNMVMRVASLELAPLEEKLLAPLKGIYGPFHVSGNCLPVFTYLVFDKSKMEFVDIRVEISRPDRIQFIATVHSSDPLFHGKLAEVCDAYEAPFWALATHLYLYFPLVHDPERKRNPYGSLAKPIEAVQSPSSGS
jgi:hypothetical protein